MERKELDQKKMITTRHVSEKHVVILNRKNSFIKIGAEIQKSHLKPFKGTHSLKMNTCAIKN